MTDNVTAGSIPPDKKVIDWTHIKLTPLEESDIDLLYVWQNLPSIRDLTMGFRFPIQKETVKEWIKNQREQNGKTRVVFAIRQNENLIGTIQLHCIEPYQRKALLGVYIGEPKSRNQGSGFVASSLLIDYAFQGLDMRKIGLEVLSINHSAIALYEKLGFKKEGTKIGEYFLGGQYLDVLIFGLQRKDWKIEIPAAANRLIGVAQAGGLSNELPSQ
jgi:UDP-4-amino-4,6-dideoxy-N-acetyl-beta-L-altrosamine N-acetyltransferase